MPDQVDLPALATPSTVDAGFDELLPFDDDLEPGEAEADLAGDEVALLTFERSGRGLLVPLAAGLVLALWAAHLRHLGRLAQR